MELYLLTFCRVAVGFVFAVSSGGKVLKIQEFQRAILRFRLLPARLTAPAAFWFLCSEIAVVLLMIVGGPLLLPGFALALLLLTLFSGALLSVLARGISTSCNCFGPDQREVSFADLWRNLGFFLCALGGCTIVVWVQKIREELNVIEWILTTVAAVVFVMV